MKKMHFNVKIGLVLLLVISSATLFALAISKRKKAVMEPKKPAPVERPIVYDPVLLNRFTNTIRSLDFNKVICTYAGVIRMDDPNDTTNNVRELQFRFCRKGANYYYRVGNVEIIHQDGLNLYVEHDQQKVVISNQEIKVKAPIRDLEVIVKNLRSENYRLNSSGNGTRQTLSLINEQHLSCKELSITLDTVTNKLERVYMRLNDFGSPADKGKDRVIDVRVSEISDQANRNKYPVVADVVLKQSNGWALTEKYSSYELIKF